MTQRQGDGVDGESSAPDAAPSPPVPPSDQAPVESADHAAAEAPAVGPEGAAAPADDAPPGPEAEPAPLTLEQQLDEAREQQRRTRDQLLRAVADYDNFRKRSRRELDDARRRSAMATIRELLPVFDNLERASSVQAVSDAAAIADGLRLVLRQFVETLRKLGVDRIDAVGGPFDPTTQESLQMVESNDCPAGSVVAVIQAGYRMGNELLRPAMVVVSKGPAANVEPPAEQRPSGAGEAAAAVGDPPLPSGADAPDEAGGAS